MCAINYCYQCHTNVAGNHYVDVLSEAGPSMVRTRKQTAAVNDNLAVLSIPTRHKQFRIMLYCILSTIL